MSTIQIRIDKKQKEEVRGILNKLGLDMSSAIKLFLRQTTIHKGLPFLLLTENGLSREEEAAIIKAAQEAKKGKNISKKMDIKTGLKFLECK